MNHEWTAFGGAARVNTLRCCQLFAGAATEDLQTIAEFSHPVSFKKGDFLFREGEPSRGFYVVQSGAINLHRVNPSGKEQVLSVFRAGDSFAEATLAMETGYPAQACAIESAVLLQIPKNDFIALLRKRPELALRMLGAMSQHLRVLVGLLDDLQLKDAETRMVHWLVKRCPKPISSKPCTIELDRPKRILASEMGTTGETLSRTLAKLKKLKLIGVKGKSIQIASPHALHALLQKNLGGC